MAEEVLISISLIIALAALTSIIARVIKQPSIIAYLVAGVLAGPLFFNIIGGSSSEVIQLFAHLGVAFLLFIVGLNLDLRVLKEVGPVSIIAGIIGMIITALIGFFITSYLGIPYIAGLYLGAVFAFSSTVVVVKILSDKKEIDTLHGRIALGILIVQDFAAAIVLMIIPLLNKGGSISSIFMTFIIAILMIIFIFFFTHKIINRFLNYLARNPETLFLFGIAWALTLSTVFVKLGFSLEIGALIAGMSLASSKYTHELGGKLKSLRDFFVVLFFVFFGSQLTGEIGFDMIKLALIFSIFILVGKPLILMAVLRIFGYKRRTNFLTGISLAQISEFSLILTLLGYNLGHLSREIMSLSVLIAIITIGISSYGIYYSNYIFKRVSRLLGIFEKDDVKIIDKKEKYDVVLFGYHRIGHKIVNSLKELNIKFLVVDYNPKVVLALGKQGIDCVYGDAADKDFLNELSVYSSKLVISTIPDEYSNIIIKEYLSECYSPAVFIATAEQSVNAIDLYSLGVDYVILPHHLGGEYAAHLIKSFHVDKKKYKEAGKKHLKELRRGKKDSLFR
ncbi:MAG: cation:proton antiporter family protein [Candidatus Pacearchaeota archaeon]|jgi:Kef-type K+ transport system membrane component KefB